MERSEPLQHGYLLGRGPPQDLPCFAQSTATLSMYGVTPQDVTTGIRRQCQVQLSRNHTAACSIAGVRIGRGGACGHLFDAVNLFAPEAGAHHAIGLYLFGGAPLPGREEVVGTRAVARAMTGCLSLRKMVLLETYAVCLSNNLLVASSFPSGESL